MNRVSRSAFVFLSAVFMLPFAFAQSDKEGSKDYPGITRMPGYYVYDYQEAQFDSANFTVTQNGKKSEQQIEGHVIKLHYNIKDGAPATSTLQVVRNYQNAARSIGGQVLDDSRGDNWYNTTLRLKKEGKETWILLEARSESHWLTIVEREAMQQDVVIDAAAMADGINSNGSVAVYGIYFDTAKSEVKPESEPALAEIAKLLKQDPALKVYIVGHTDMVGDPAANLKLSQARAQAVVQALVTKYGVGATRMTPFGNGSYAPVASNKTDEGRAKNRRVELVEISAK